MNTMLYSEASVKPKGILLFVNLITLLIAFYFILSEFLTEKSRELPYVMPYSGPTVTGHDNNHEHGVLVQMAPGQSSTTHYHQLHANVNVDHQLASTSHPNANPSNETQANNYFSPFCDSQRRKPFLLFILFNFRICICIYSCETKTRCS